MGHVIPVYYVYCILYELRKLYLQINGSMSSFKQTNILAPCSGVNTHLLWPSSHHVWRRLSVGVSDEVLYVISKMPELTNLGLGRPPYEAAEFSADKLASTCSAQCKTNGISK